MMPPDSTTGLPIESTDAPFNTLPKAKNNSKILTKLYDNGVSPHLINLRGRLLEALCLSHQAQDMFKQRSINH